jgi:hypothetical protein
MTMHRTILSGAIALLACGLALDATKPAQADQTVRCESNDGRTQRCNVDTGGGVRLQRQLSSAGCWEGDTWGYDRRAIWVSNGCRAEFRVGSSGGSHSSDNSGAAVAAVALGVIAAAAIASHNHDKHDDRYDHDGGYYPPSYPQQNYTIDCRSVDFRYARCPVDIRRGRAEIIRQHSKTQCQFGRNWGYDRNAVWVSDGCQAEFAIYR